MVEGKVDLFAVQLALQALRLDAGQDAAGAIEFVIACPQGAIRRLRGQNDCWLGWQSGGATAGRGDAINGWAGYRSRTTGVGGQNQQS